MRVTQKKLDNTLKKLDHIVKVYKKKYSKEPKRDWRMLYPDIISSFLDIYF